MAARSCCRWCRSGRRVCASWVFVCSAARREGVECWDIVDGEVVGAWRRASRRVGFWRR